MSNVPVRAKGRWETLLSIATLIGAISAIMGLPISSSSKTALAGGLGALLGVISISAKFKREHEPNAKKAENELPPRWIDYIFASFPPELRDEHIGNMTAHFDWCFKRRKSVNYAKTMCTIAVIGILVRLIPSKVMKAVYQHFIAPK